MGVCLIMAISTDAYWGGGGGGGIFVSNRAFLCRTMHFAIEPGFFMSNECYNARPSADMIDALCV